MTDNISIDYSRQDRTKVEYEKDSEAAKQDTGSGKSDSQDKVIEIHNLHRQLIENNQVSLDNRLQDVDQARELLATVKRQISESEDPKAMMEKTFSMKRDNLIELLN